MGGQERERVQETERLPTIELGVPFAPFTEADLGSISEVEDQYDGPANRFYLQGIGEVLVALMLHSELPFEDGEDIEACYVDPSGRYAAPLGPVRFVYREDEYGDPFRISPWEPHIAVDSDRGELPGNLRCLITFEDTDFTYVGTGHWLFGFRDGVVFDFQVPRDVERSSARDIRLLLPPDPVKLSSMRVTFFLHEERPSGFERIGQAAKSLLDAVGPAAGQIRGLFPRLDQIRGPQKGTRQD